MGQLPILLLISRDPTVCRLQPGFLRQMIFAGLRLGRELQQRAAVISSLLHARTAPVSREKRKEMKGNQETYQETFLFLLPLYSLHPPLQCTNP